MRKARDLAEALSLTLLALGATDDDDPDDDDAGDEEEEYEQPPSRGGHEELKRVRAEAKRRRLEAREERKKREETEATVKRLQDRLSALEGDKQAGELREEIKAKDAEIADTKLLLEFERVARGVSMREGVLGDVWGFTRETARAAVSDDGTIDTGKLRSVIDSVLERHPYFKEDPEETNGDEDYRRLPNTTGAGPARGKYGKNGPDNRAALEKRFPALRSRDR